MRLTLPRAIAVSLVLALAIAVTVRLTSGGDGTGHAAVARPPVPRPLVTRADFAPLDRSGPGSLVLRWWQANQFNQPPPKVALFYASWHRPSPRALRRDLQVTSYFFDETKPVVIDESVNGGSAEVFTLIPAPGKSPTDAGGVPYVFHVAREAGQWRLVDDFIAHRAAGERAFANSRKTRR